MEKIILISFGEVEKEIIKKISRQISRVFDLKIVFFGQRSIPWTGKRGKQLKASDFLVNLAEILENDEAGFALGLTSEDIFLPNLNFVFGLASPRDQVAMVSLARLIDKNEKIFLERIKKEVIHEIGHLFYLEHCSKSTCVMHFANNLADVDLKSFQFCLNCQNALKKNAQRIS